MVLLTDYEMQTESNACAPSASRAGWLSHSRDQKPEPMNHPTILSKDLCDQCHLAL
jgi:hypothetical protein